MNFFLTFRRENGNVLFLVLIAVALFAAMSYAVTRSGGGGGTVSHEKNALLASQIVSTAVLVKQAVDRLRLIGGCTDTEISFDTQPYNAGNDFYNPNSPGDFRCHVFDPAGGGLSLPPPPKEAHDTSLTGLYRWGYSHGSCINGLGSTLAADACGGAHMELIVAVGRITDAVCTEINRGLGITPATPPTENYTGPFFAGSYSGTGNVHGFPDTRLAGKEAGCLKDGNGSTTGHNFFYLVLIVR